jgi:hypothetical protein
MKTKRKTTSRVIRSVALMLMLSAQISLAGSATWLASPADNLWRNAANWTSLGPPNGAFDTATFSISNIHDVVLDTSVELSGIVFDGDAFTITGAPNSMAMLDFRGAGITTTSMSLQNFVNFYIIDFVNLTTSAGTNTRFTNTQFLYFYTNSTADHGTFITNENGVLYFESSSTVDYGTFITNENGVLYFENSSTAANGTFTNNGATVSNGDGGLVEFLDTSTAANGHFTNNGGTVSGAGGGGVLFGGATAANGTFTNNGGTVGGAGGGVTSFEYPSTAGNAILIANGGTNGGDGGTISFEGGTGGTAVVKVFGNGNLSGGGVTIGSIEGTGNVFLGSSTLSVGSNNLNTTFSGAVQDGGNFAKIGTGMLTFQGRPTNDYIANTVGLILVNGSIINLNFTGPPDLIRSLVVNGFPQPPGVYGSVTSGAPNQISEFAGPGTVQVGSTPTPTPMPTPTPTSTRTPTPTVTPAGTPTSTPTPATAMLSNISTRSFVQTGEHVMIGGFIIQGTGTKTVIIRAIGPELTQYGITDVLANPTLQLYNSAGALIGSNDNWQTTIIGGVITGNQVSE